MWNCLFVFLIALSVVSSKNSYVTKWFTVPLDHFGFQRNETFRIKYLENEDNWDRTNGPIFFYTGNEGQIESFANYTGFMWEIAEEFRAKLVFAEHRYYGESMPFGNKSLDNDHIGFLSSAQALADYADLVTYLQGDGKQILVPQYPVISFGGSYGGMLSAYFRMKYPHIVNGAIAASAPIHMYPGMVPCDVFNRIVTSSFTIISKKCSDNIRQSWSLIRSYASTANGSAELHSALNLCGESNTTDIETLVTFLETMYVNLAMVNYPFPCEFLMSLPARPVASVCQFLNETLTDKKLLEGIGKVANVYSNYGKKTNECVDYKKGDSVGNLDSQGWDYQACTEMIMPMCSTGRGDMFEPDPWNITQYAEDCHKKYNVYPRSDMARVQYGGNLLQAASNIVFSNGLLDPWVAGGILNGVSDSVKAVVIVDAAHHLDLMPSNPADPDSVKQARNIHKQNINKWINDFNVRQKHLRH